MKTNSLKLDLYIKIVYRNVKRLRNNLVFIKLRKIRQKPVKK